MPDQVHEGEASWWLHEIVEPLVHILVAFDMLELE